MNSLPYRWQDWARFEQREGFIAWAESAPTDTSESRYAVVRWNGIRWARVSPNPDVSPEYSSGCFYDTGDPNDYPEGAIEWAKRSAMHHREHVRKLLAR